MYSIVEGTEIDIPQSFINKSLGYKENFVVQGFQVLDHEKFTSFKRPQRITKW